MSLFLKRIFCNHDYEKINEITVSSEFDNIVQYGARPLTWHSVVRKYVTDFNCKKCGKLRRKIVTTSKS